MKIFVDSADIEDIRALHDLGMADGVTTNPSIIARSGRDIKQVIGDICALLPGPVSAPCAAADYDGMVAEGRVLGKIADNVAVKLPLTWPGLRACRTLRADGLMVNMTLCFSANQALLAARAGATFVSPFVGRIDDLHANGMETVAAIRKIFDNFGFETRILLASLRSANHIRDAAALGVDAITAPPPMLLGLAGHVLTDRGLAGFQADWAESGQSIL